MAKPTRILTIVPQEFPTQAPFVNATHAFFGPTQGEVTLSFMRVPPGPIQAAENVEELRVPVVTAVTMTVDVAAGLARSIVDNLPAEARSSFLATMKQQAATVKGEGS